MPRRLCRGRKTLCESEERAKHAVDLFVVYVIVLACVKTRKSQKKAFLKLGRFFLLLFFILLPSLGRMFIRLII